MDRFIAVFSALLWVIITLYTLAWAATESVWPPLWWSLLLLGGGAFIALWIYLTFRDPYDY